MTALPKSTIAQLNEDIDTTTPLQQSRNKIQERVKSHTNQQTKNGRSAMETKRGEIRKEELKEYRHKSMIGIHKYMYRALVAAIWAIYLLALTFVLVLAWHYLVPERFCWLDQDETQKILSFIIGIISTPTAKSIKNYAAELSGFTKTEGDINIIQNPL